MHGKKMITVTFTTPPEGLQNKRPPDVLLGQERCFGLKTTRAWRTEQDPFT